MRELHRGLIRILKGPTGGLLTSLALAAVLGGVAIAAPGPSLGPASEHHGGVGTPTGPVDGLSISAGVSAGESDDGDALEVRSRFQPLLLGSGRSAAGGAAASDGHDRTVDGPGQAGSGAKGDGPNAQPPSGPPTPGAHSDGPATDPGSGPTPNDPAHGPVGPDPSRGVDRGSSPNQPNQPNQPSGNQDRSGPSGPAGSDGHPGGADRS